MDYIFDDWIKTLNDFKSSVEKDLEEIRKHKAEVQQIKAAIDNEMNAGRYIRDPRRIVLSAPEIIIGNVDKSGNLIDAGGSTIILRANQIREDGVGTAGSVETRAASIRHLAVDPGMDGNEAVVGSISEVVSQARNITLQSNNPSTGSGQAGVFPLPPLGTVSGGVRIHADTRLELEAAQSSEWKKSHIEERIKNLESSKNSLKSNADSQKSVVDKAFKEMQSLMDSVEALRDTDDDVRTNMLDIQELNDQIKFHTPFLYNAVDKYINDISLLAETNRQITALKKEKESIPAKDDFKKKSTGASLSLRGEHISIASEDGDGNLRDNPESGIDIAANRMTVTAREHSGELKKDGRLLINAKTIGISTANTKLEDDGKKGTIAAEGDILITTKTLTLEALDREIKDGKAEEKALTKDGQLSIRVEKTDLSATDTEGKATGSVTLNSKTVQVKSMDVDKEKRTDDKLAAGSTMLLLAEKMYVGAKDKDHKSKTLQAVGEEMGLFADKTLEAQQGEAKAVLQLADGNAALSGSKTQLFGESTLNGKTEVKDELKAPKATIDNVEAKSSFKSSNISDGFPVPPAPSTAKLSAKLKTEDLKEPET